MLVHFLSPLEVMGITPGIFTTLKQINRKYRQQIEAREKRATGAHQPLLLHKHRTEGRDVFYYVQSASTSTCVDFVSYINKSVASLRLHEEDE
jgi:hypothetical protein